MKKLFKALFAGLGALLSLSACSLIPEDRTTNNQPYLCHFEFDAYTVSNPTYQVNEMNIRLVNGAGKYISFGRPTVSSDNPGMVSIKGIFSKDNNTWAVTYECDYELSANFTVSYWMNREIIRDKFTVKFYHDGSIVPPSGDYTVATTMPSDTLCLDVWKSSQSYLFAIESTQTGQHVYIDDVNIKCDGISYSVTEDHDNYVRITFHPQSYYLGNCIVTLTSDNGVEVEKDFDIAVDNYSVRAEYEAPFIVGIASPVTIYVAGDQYGRRKMITYASFESTNGCINYSEVRSASPTDYLTAYLNPTGVTNPESIRVFATCEDGQSYEIYFGVSIIENMEVEIANYQNFSSFSDLRPNSHYEFDVKIHGINSGSFYSIMNIYFEYVSSDYIAFSYYLIDNYTARVTMNTQSKIGSKNIRLVATNEYGQEVRKNIGVAITNN